MAYVPRYHDAADMVGTMQWYPTDLWTAIALCALLFDAAAVRLWFLDHRVGSAAIGLIAGAALVVTFTNSLGAIAGRADTTLAQRTKLADNRSLPTRSCEAREGPRRLV
jgi:hypothetical protein